MLNEDGSWKTRLLCLGERSSGQVGRIAGYLLVCKREQTWRLESEVEGSGGSSSGGDDAEGSLFVVDGGESGGAWIGVEGGSVGVERCVGVRGGMRGGMRSEGFGATRWRGAVQVVVDGGRRRDGSGGPSVQQVCNGCRGSEKRRDGAAQARERGRGVGGGPRPEGGQRGWSS
ncbi:hypothetical protein COCMIDRAFT_24648 [Bipolaris oryzae ATCC 44560]|uniref:Uncharacterized protein n=1 Tax=Bipolaris oryzae ATCC 44560 TaxID=930090 RepID=W6Z6W9_COCMI|nr:uncharacterized protein COCMIDRAFT_24648 [Bipolaris oryzae ATCC 44560]EUC47487.1 hypothetical protein COCMIDRAFT_24648 [Bipolaris oryzae ATCC 44560]